MKLVEASRRQPQLVNLQSTAIAGDPQALIGGLSEVRSTGPDGAGHRISAAFEQIGAGRRHFLDAPEQTRAVL
jgi:hypothetical protein